MKKNKNYVTTTLTVFLFILIAAGCCIFLNQSRKLGPFVGEWYCGETSLEDKNFYTGYLALDVSKNGDFSIYDAEAGNPGIAGKMKINSDTELTVTCGTDDFDPPPGWYNMKDKQILQYSFVSENELHLIFTDNDKTSTLVFYRSDDEEDGI